MALSPFELTNAAKTAIHFINSTNSHIFLTGKAGTGKTTFLKNLSLHTHKQFAIVAPTGIAALNAGGVTIHSQFLFPFGMFVPESTNPPAGNCYTQDMLASKHPLNDARRQVLRSIDLLVIDEVSMLRCDLLDAIDYRLRSVRSNFAQSFGGVQLLLIGDLFQLPPVVKAEEEAILKRYYKNQWFFESRALTEDGFVYIELDKIYRQQDNTFIDLLNNLRNNTPTRADIDLLNTHYRSSEEIDQTGDPVITLTTHNYKADELNRRALESLETAAHILPASIEGDFPPNMYPVLQELVLKEGAQIMFTKNDNEKVYFNGRLATVVTINSEGIRVELEGTKVIYTLKKEVWENKRYVVDPVTKEITDEVLGTFEQYPVKLAWAITVHKSQGLTFSKAIIDVGSAFADGQVYVALSRLRSLDGLILRTRIDPAVISTDKQIVRFSENNHEPDALPLTLKSKQREYILHLVTTAFEFEAILRYLGYVQRSHERSGVDMEEDEGIAGRLHALFLSERGNTGKFRQQLQQLLTQENYTQLLERVQKGSTYYREFLWTQLRVLLAHIPRVARRKGGKSYMSSLDELDLLMMKKLEQVDKVSALTENIIAAREEYDFSQLARARSARRNSIIGETVAMAPESRAKKKRKRRSPSGKKKDRRPSHEISLEAFTAGQSIADIATSRGVTVSTIEGHLVRCVAEGKMNIFDFLGEEKVAAIMSGITGCGTTATFGAVYSKLKGGYSFNEIRAVFNHYETPRSAVPADPEA